MEFDNETQQYHTWFRQYPANMGRWLTPDPLFGRLESPQSLNRYAFAGNNPLRYVDPLGLMYCKVTTDKDGKKQYSDCVSDEDYEKDKKKYRGHEKYVHEETMTVNADESKESDDTSWIRKVPWSVSWVIPITPPIPGVMGIGPAGNFYFNPQTGTFCSGIGIGASAGRNVAGGPVAAEKLNGKDDPTSSELDDMQAGGSINGGVNVPPIVPAPVGPGAQASLSGSGVTLGPTIGVVGGSISATYTACSKPD